MKKAFMLVLGGVSGCAVLAGALAFSGPIRFNDLQVHANPVEYSVTFDGSGSTTVKKVNNDYAIYTTTPRGAKVGVVGNGNSYQSFTFNSVSFRRLQLYDYNNLLKGAGAYQFSTITGFAISFTGGSVVFNGGSTYIDDVVSGHEYTGLSTIPDYFPEFTVTNGSVTVTSLTISYSC